MWLLLFHKAKFSNFLTNAGGKFDGLICINWIIYATCSSIWSNFFAKVITTIRLFCLMRILLLGILVVMFENATR